MDGWLTGLLDVSISRGHVSIDGSFLLLPFRSAKGLWVVCVMRMGGFSMSACYLHRAVFAFSQFLQPKGLIASLNLLFY